MVSHRAPDSKDPPRSGDSAPGWKYRHVVDLIALALIVAGILMLLIVGDASGGVITALAGVLAGIFRVFMGRN